MKQKTRLMSRKEYESLVKTFPKDSCPLCERKRQIVLGETRYWLWIAGLSPYWRHHTMLIPKKHIKTVPELSLPAFADFKKFYNRIVAHLIKLKVKHSDKRLVDQFLLMVRDRRKIKNGSTYYKPEHLHIHLLPDLEGIGRFAIDESALKINIRALAFKKHKTGNRKKIEG